MVISIIRPLDCTSDTYRDLGRTKCHRWSIDNRDIDRIWTTGYDMYDARHLRMVPAEVREVSCCIKDEFCFTTKLLDVVGIEHRLSIRIRHHMKKHWHMISVDDRPR